MKTYPVSAVWLRTAESQYAHLQKLEVLLEIDGQWRLVQEAHVPAFEAEIGIITSGGIGDAPLDIVTEVES